MAGLKTFVLKYKYKILRRIRVIPVLLMKNGGLVKTIRFKHPTYIGDPINAVKIFNEKEVDEIVLLDIDATLQNREPDYDKIKEICSEAFMPFAYGGGIKNIDQVKRLFQNGIEKVIFNTEVFLNPQILEKAATIFGNQSIVVSIDVKKDFFGKYKVFVKSGKHNTKYNPLEYAKKVEDFGSGEIFLTSIGHEGTYKGYDIELIKAVSHSVTIPVIAHGGANSIMNFLTAIEAGASAVAAGSIFVYKGVEKGILISYPNQEELKINLFNKL
jgi:imidazole glycerol-phosphate synthase subunit HisF